MRFPHFFARPLNRSVSVTGQHGRHCIISEITLKSIRRARRKKGKKSRRRVKRGRGVGEPYAVVYARTIVFAGRGILIIIPRAVPRNRRTRAVRTFAARTRARAFARSHRAELQGGGRIKSIVDAVGRANPGLPSRAIIPRARPRNTLGGGRALLLLLLLVRSGAAAAETGDQTVGIINPPYDRVYIIIIISGSKMYIYVYMYTGCSRYSLTARRMRRRLRGKRERTNKK